MTSPELEQRFHPSPLQQLLDSIARRMRNPAVTPEQKRAAIEALNRVRDALAPRDG